MAELCTAFELNETECKIVLLRAAKQQMSLAAAATVSFIDETTGESVNDRRKSQLIRDALKQKKIAVHNAMLVLPKHTAQVRCVTLPSDKDEELTRMARFEAGKIIPFNVENHIISHHVLKKDSIRGSRVIIAAVEDKNADEQIQLLKHAGVDVEYVTVSNIALYNIFHILEPRNITEETYTLLSIGHHSIDISIIDKGLLIFSRSSLSGLDRLMSELYPQESRSGRLNLELVRRLQAATQRAGGPESAPAANASPGGGLGIGYQPFSDVGSAPPPPAPQQTAASSESELDTGDTPRRITLSFNGLPGESVPQPLAADHVPAVQVEEPPRAEAPAPALAPLAPAGAGEAEKLQAWLTKILQEIRRTYEFSRREFEIPAISRLFITGEGAAIQGLEDYFNANLGIESVTLNPLKSEMIKGASDVLTTPLENFAYTVVAGGALGVLWDDACRINLIPQRYVTLRQARIKRLNLIITGGLAAAAVLLGVFCLVKYHDANKQQLRWYTLELNNINPVYQEIQDISKKKKILDSHIRDRRSALGILEQISQFDYIHEKVALLEFKYIKGDTLVLQGHALTIDDIGNFIYDLEHMEADPDTGARFFSAVRERQRRTTRLPRRNEEIYVFYLECDIAKTGRTSASMGGGN